MRAALALIATLLSATPAAANWRTTVAKATETCANKISGRGVALCSPGGMGRNVIGALEYGRFQVRNSNPHAIRDLQIECSHHAPSGTVLGHSRQSIYVAVPAGGAVWAEALQLGFIHPQVATFECAVISWAKVP